ncbi:hypothetical protein, partial [Klebsiella oxytoca]|uniref:hypothetical protein n=2 Tax=Klebsiella oxytoca TaxID=571 RepID=UPI0025990CC2
IPAEQAPGEIPAPAPCAVCENRSEPTGGYVAYVMETRTVIITGCAVTHCMKKVKFLFTTGEKQNTIKQRSHLAGRHGGIRPAARNVEYFV